MLIERLNVKGLLSFGPDGIDLPLEPLNVLIGPNGSGKSNLLKVLALLQTAPADLSKHANESGDTEDWFWEKRDARPKGIIEANFSRTQRLGCALRHAIQLRPSQGRFMVTEDVYRVTGENWSLVARTDGKGPVYKDSSDTCLGDLWPPLDRSLLSTVNHEHVTTDWPDASDAFAFLYLLELKRFYKRVQLHLNWTFGEFSPSRLWQDTTIARNDAPEAGTSLATTLSVFPPSLTRTLEDRLHRFYEGFIGVSTPVRDGKISLLIEEAEGRLVPAARLSDGTLRFLSLLTILLNPNPPPLIAIEEPELGLHPDVIYDLAELMVEASTRTQVVVTTHSPTLIDALSDHPSSVIACEKHDGQTHFRRVNPDDLTSWQGDRGLGELWSMGSIGGTRW